MTDKIVKAIYNGVEYEIDAGGGGITVCPNVELLLVGGGGGGGGGSTVSGGGGGGGGVLFCNDYPIEEGKQYCISVGCGGAGGTSSSSCGARGGSTELCDCSGIIAKVTGGWGGGYGNTACNCGGVGGGAYSTPSTMDYGCCAGGANACRAGGGGGSSFSDGVAAKNYQYTYTGGNGGDGYISNISGTITGYGGGGGGGGYYNSYSCGGTGGAGGGHGGDRTTYTAIGCIHAIGCGGGGGGGLTQTSCCGGNGACGVVIVRYHCDGRDGIDCLTVTGCVCSYECSGYCIHCFTGDGTFLIGTPSLCDYSDITSMSADNAVIELNKYISLYYDKFNSEGHIYEDFYLSDDGSAPHEWANGGVYWMVYSPSSRYKGVPGPT